MVSNSEHVDRVQRSLAESGYNGPFPASFSLFSTFQHLTLKTVFNIKFCP